MANAVIPLALSKFTPSKVEYPAYVSIKYDGVPVKLTVVVDPDGIPYRKKLRTRSNEINLSAETIINEWYEANKSFFEGFVGTHEVVGEVTQLLDPYADFKDTSGIVRRQCDQGHILKWNIFDYDWDGGDKFYGDRIGLFSDKTLRTANAGTVSTKVVYNEADLNTFFEEFTEEHPKAEGLIVRNANCTYIPNKRSGGYQKLVHEPMADLWAVGVTEAVSGSGEPKGMVGGIVIRYKGKLSKASAGKLNHAERKELWEQVKCLTSNERTGLGNKPNLVWLEFGTNLMAQIKHKKDDSYDALRQPTFQCWRPDKDIADA